MCAGSFSTGTSPRHAMQPVKTGLSSPTRILRMRECTPSAPISASPVRRSPLARCSVTCLPVSSKPYATRAEPDRVRRKRPHRIDQHLMQIRAMDHEIGRAVARDRLGSEVEQLPGLAGVPEADFLGPPARSTPRGSRASSPSANSTRAPFAEICTPAPSSASCGACSQTSTSWPSRNSASAAVKPADPRADDQNAHMSLRHSGAAAEGVAAVRNP